MDVAQEHAVRADDEHTLVFEREPIRVEQVGGAVQRDDGLAGARTALHDEHAGKGRPDDLVLLGLDRRDDVAELAGARLLDPARSQTGVSKTRSTPPLLLTNRPNIQEGNGQVLNKWDRHP